MDKVKRQIENFKKAMEEAIDKGFAEKEEERDERFFESEFILTFCDKTTGKSHKINLFICPETWELFQNLTSNDLPELLEDYE